MVTLSIFIGCGSSDLLEESPTRYSAYALPFDGGDDSTNEIDVVQSICEDEPEPYYPFDVNVVIETDSDSENNSGNEFYVESYDVTLRTNHGSYYDGSSWVTLAAAEMPDLTDTDLNPLHYPTSSTVIEPDTVVTLDLQVWGQGDKEAYADKVEEVIGVYIGNSDFFYDVRVVLNCRNLEDNTFELTTPWTTVHFSNFDKCD
jgi:hypothetical protein